MVDVMSNYLGKLCEFMHDRDASKSVTVIEPNKFRIYMTKTNANGFENNVKMNHTDEIIHISTGSCLSDVHVYERTTKGRFECVGGRKLKPKRTVYFVEFKFTELAYAFYDAYEEWGEL